MLDEIDLYLTNRCNLTCSFCSIQARAEMEELSLNEIKNLVDEAKRLGLQELHLTGGEPTLRSDLEEIVSYVVSSGLHTRLITNGTTLTSDRLKRLWDCGLRSIMISLDGYQAYHNKERGDHAFERAIQTIRNAVSMGMFVRVNSVAWTDNRDQLLTFPSFLNEMGVKVFSIFLGSPLGYAQSRKQKVIDPYDWARFCDDIKAGVHDISMKVVIEKGFLFSNENSYDISNFKGRGRGCYGLTEHEDFFLVRCNGDVYPCVFFSNEAPPIGNIKKESLESVLRRFRNDNFYQAIGTIPAECSDCAKAPLCKGGCKGYCKLMTGAWVGKDPRCVGPHSGAPIPLCPIVKINVTDDVIGGSSEQVL